MEQELKNKFEAILGDYDFGQSDNDGLISLMYSTHTMGYILAKSEYEERIKELEKTINQMATNYENVGEGGKVAVCKRILKHLTRNHEKY